MLTRDQIDERLAHIATHGEATAYRYDEERDALETAQKLGNLLADLRAHCIDCEVAIAERKADAWLRGEGEDAS